MSRPVTLVLGASPKPYRYSNMAVRRLLEHGFPVVAVGRRAGVIGDVAIVTEIPAVVSIDTVTLYLNPQNQQPWIEPLLALKPRRIIFNPGTEHPAFEARLHDVGVEAIEACTLVMLSVGSYGNDMVGAV